MKKFITVLHQSFYAKQLYQSAALEWKGIGIGLLAMLSLALAVVISLSLLIGANTDGEYQEFRSELISQFPAIKIEKGELSMDKESPYYMGSDKEKIVVIDTSEAANQMSIDDVLKKMNTEKLAVFVTKTKFIALKSDNETRIHDLSEVKETISFDKTDVKKWVGILEKIAIPVMFLFLIPIFFVYKIIQMFLYSVMAIGFDKFLKTGISYEAMQRITTCALFPATIVGAVGSIIGLDVTFLISFTITLGYIYFGLKSVSEAK